MGQFLVDILSSFQNLTTQALGGNYSLHDAFEDLGALRLATGVVTRNEKFSRTSPDRVIYLTLTLKKSRRRNSTQATLSLSVKSQENGFYAQENGKTSLKSWMYCQRHQICLL